VDLILIGLGPLRRFVDINVLLSRAAKVAPASMSRVTSVGARLDRVSSWWMRIGLLRPRSAIGLLLVIGALVHIQSLFVGFVADDFELLKVASSSSLGHLLSDPFPAGRGTYFRPLIMASLAITPQPFLHHLINLLIHLTNGVLIFIIAQSISTKKTSATPLLAALIFLIHPIVAYDVNWISGRTDSFACLFSLLVLHSVTKTRPILAALSLVLALSSKEVALSTPISALALYIFLTPPSLKSREVEAGEGEDREVGAREVGASSGGRGDRKVRAREAGQHEVGGRGRKVGDAESAAQPAAPERAAPNGSSEHERAPAGPEVASPAALSASQHAPNRSPEVGAQPAAFPSSPERALNRTPALIGLGLIAVGWIGLLAGRFYRTPSEVGALSVANVFKGIASVPILFVWPNSFWEVRHLLLSYPVLLPLSALLLLAPLVFAVRWVSRHRDRRRAALALFVLATAPLLPLFLASLVPSTRLMYLPLATTCIALVGLRQIIEPPRPRQLIPISLVAIALMIVGSVLRGHRWIENSQLIATYCNDFIALRRDAPPNTTPLFVTYPFELDDTPLFVHHTHSTLRACAPSDTKVSDAMIVVGPIVMARSPSGPVVRAERRDTSTSRIDFQITDASSFFGFEVPLAINTPLSFPEVTFIATEANNPREVRGLSTTFPPESIANADLLYFDGQHLRRIGAP
jgi:hypothetical protein